MALPKQSDLKLTDVKIGKPTIGAQFSVVMGGGGVGKSTFASYSPSPVIIPVGTETGHKRMDIPCFQNEKGIHPLLHLYQSIQWLLTQEHKRETVIIDNFTSYREVVEKDVEKDNVGVDLNAFGKKNALGYPYYAHLLSAISELMTQRNLHVILICHDAPYTINEPDGSYYQRISVSAPSGDNTNVRKLIEAKADNVFYIVSECPTMIAKDKFGTKKKIATKADVKRIIYTKETGNFFAKSRVNMELFYEIENTMNENDLLKLRNNKSIINFWADAYA